jgi:hypothetical protein
VPSLDVRYICVISAERFKGGTSLARAWKPGLKRYGKPIKQADSAGAIANQRTSIFGTQIPYKRIQQWPHLFRVIASVMNIPAVCGIRSACAISISRMGIYNMCCIEFNGNSVSGGGKRKYKKYDAPERTTYFSMIVI